MATHGLQTWARWGYASGDNFFNEPYPQNETDYLPARGTAYTVAASPRGATESGNTVTITTRRHDAVISARWAPPSAISGVTGAAATTAPSRWPHDAPPEPDHLHRPDLRPGRPAPATVSAPPVPISPATNQIAWELAAKLPVVGSGLGGNAVPWTLMGEAVSVSGVPSPSTTGNVRSTAGQPAGAPHLHSPGQLDVGHVQRRRRRLDRGQQVTIPAPANGSNDGVHTVQYYALDAAATRARRRRPRSRSTRRRRPPPPRRVPRGWTNWLR